MDISVKIYVDKTLKGKSRLQKNQMPFSAALGLTMTANIVAKVEQRMMAKELNPPAQFTFVVSVGRAQGRPIASWASYIQGFS